MDGVEQNKRNTQWCGDGGGGKKTNNRERFHVKECTGGPQAKMKTNNRAIRNDKKKAPSKTNVKLDKETDEHTRRKSSE